MKNIILIGMMGCGKSTIGRMLAERISYQYVDMDTYLENKYHSTIPELFSVSELYFRDKETECCKDMGHTDNKIISTGGGVILREENMLYLKNNGLVFFIDRPVEMIINELNTDHRPLLKDGVFKLYDLEKERRSLYEKYADFIIRNDQLLIDVRDKIISLYGKSEGANHESGR